MGLLQFPVDDNFNTILKILANTRKIKDGSDTVSLELSLLANSRKLFGE